MNITPQIKLKPCPFCGGEAKIIKTLPSAFDRGMVMVRCEECKARSLTSCVAYDLKAHRERTEEEAIEYVTRAWNRRATA